MRLTADLIHASLSYINPIQERELDLRGNKIPAIENLGVASRDNDCIDFTDNDITYLANFPNSPRLQTLLLTRNRVTSIQLNLHKALPNLTSLVLAENRIAELADLEPLSNLSRLTYLVLNDNPVRTKENYRFWMIWRCRKLRFLDYQKVKMVEREKADVVFGTTDKPTKVVSEILSTKSNVSFERAPLSGVSGDNGAVRIKLTEKERRRVEEMIKNAKSLKEMENLERLLDEGKIPGGILDDEDAMEA